MLSKASVTLDSFPSVIRLPSPKDESVGVPIATFVPIMLPPDAKLAVIVSSVYFFVAASLSDVGSPICNFAKVELVLRSVIVDPSEVVVANLKRSESSSQKITALFPAPLLIIIPASLPTDPELFNTNKLSSTSKFVESNEVVLPCTIKSPVIVWLPVILVLPVMSNLKFPGVSVPIPILPLATSNFKRSVLKARSCLRIRLDSNISPATFVIAIILHRYLPECSSG